MKYPYQSERLGSARRYLMLPHVRGEDVAIANSFHECSLAFNGLPLDDLDETLVAKIRALQRYMDTTAVEDPEGEGAWLIKARTLTVDDRLDLSDLVDDLATCFRTLV